MGGNAMTEQELLTVDEAARILRVHPNTVRDWIKAGELPASRLGKREYRISRSDLDSFVEERKKREDR